MISSKRAFLWLPQLYSPAPLSLRLCRTGFRVNIASEVEPPQPSMYRLVSSFCAFGKYCALGIAFTPTLTPIFDHIPAHPVPIFSSLMYRPLRHAIVTVYPV